MKITLSARVFVGAAYGLSLAGCVPNFIRAEPTAVVAPAPNRPYLILTADRSTVSHGETVEFTALFVNQTKRKVALPTESLSVDRFDSIEHRLEIEWKGESGGSSLGMSAVCVNSCPPSTSYLQPNASRSYRLRWKFEERGKGIATLTYHFGFSDDFPPAKITLHTR